MRSVLATGLLLVACSSPPPEPVALQVQDSPGIRCAKQDSPVVERIRSDRGTQTLRSRATVLASDDEAPSHARTRAENKALRYAVESVAGLTITSGLLSFEQLRNTDSHTLIQELTSTRIDALAVDKKIVQRNQPSKLSGDGYCYGVVLEATILDRSRNTDPGFQIYTRLERERFTPGDPVIVRVETSRDARIYVLGLYEDGMAVLLPNRFRKDTRVKAGQALVFPDASLGEDKQLLRAELPEGKRETTEVLLAIAIRDDGLLLPESLPKKGSTFKVVEASGAGALLKDYLLPLARLSPDRWTFDSTAYAIVSH